MTVRIGEIFKRWKPGYRFLVGLGLICCLTLWLSRGLAGGAWCGLFCLTALIVVGGLPRNAMRRELGETTKELMLTAPIEIKEMVWGKWIYFMGLGLRILLFGFAVALLATLFQFIHSQTLSRDLIGGVLGLAVCLSLIASISIFQISEGLQLMPKVLRTMFLYFIILCFPMGLIFVSLIAGSNLLNTPPEATFGRKFLAYGAQTLGWICLLMSIPNFMMLAGIFGETQLLTFWFAAFYFLVNCILIVPSAGLAFWVYISIEKDWFLRRNLIHRTG